MVFWSGSDEVSQIRVRKGPIRTKYAGVGVQFRKADGFPEYICAERSMYRGWGQDDEERFPVTVLIGDSG